MKTALILLIVLCFGLLGYFYKQRLKYENISYKFLKEYIEFLKANINLFKTNIVEINNKFIIMQKNKNANQYKVIIKNADNLAICFKKINNLILDKYDLSLIESFVRNVGNNDYEFEKERILNFENYVKDKELKTYENVKTKGEMWFKILLAIGAVVGILIW